MSSAAYSKTQNPSNEEGTSLEVCNPNPNLLNTSKSNDQTGASLINEILVNLSKLKLKLELEKSRLLKEGCIDGNNFAIYKSLNSELLKIPMVCTSTSVFLNSKVNKQKFAIAEILLES